MVSDHGSPSTRRQPTIERSMRPCSAVSSWSCLWVWGTVCKPNKTAGEIAASNYVSRLRTVVCMFCQGGLCFMNSASNMGAVRELNCCPSHRISGDKPTQVRFVFSANSMSNTSSSTSTHNGSSRRDVVNSLVLSTSNCKPILDNSFFNKVIATSPPGFMYNRKYIISKADVSNQCGTARLRTSPCLTPRRMHAVDKQGLHIARRKIQSH